MVDRKVRSCISCQIATPHTTREPLCPSPLPIAVFEENSIDFASVDGETLLVAVDDYSRFPIDYSRFTTTSANAAIPKLDQIFFMFRIPCTIKSDNGPLFNGTEFQRFVDHLGFHQSKTTPLWPRANGEVERFIKTLKKSIRTSKAEGLKLEKRNAKVPQKLLHYPPTAPQADLQHLSFYTVQ